MTPTTQSCVSVLRPAAISGTRITELYDGAIWDLETQEIARDRIHWLCSKVRGQHILDVGCRQGITSILLAREGFSVVGIDIDPTAIAFAEAERARLPKVTRDRLTFVEADLYGFPGRRFDTAIADKVIEHQVNPRRFLEACATLLVERGVLILTTPFGVHPHPDHKTPLFPQDIIDAAEGLLYSETLDVVDGYIRYTASRRKGKTQTDSVSRQLAKTTQTAMLASQTRLHQQLRKQAEDLQDKREQLAAAEKNVAELEAIIWAMEKRLAIVGVEAKSGAVRAAAAERLHSEVAGRRKIAGRSPASAERSLAEALERAEVAERHAQDMAQRLADQEEHISKLLASLSDKYGGPSNADSIMELLNSEFARLKSELQSARDRFECEISQQNELQAELGQSLSEKEQLRAKGDALKLRVSELEQQVADFEEQAQAPRADLDQRTVECDRLQNESTRLDLRLTELQQSAEEACKQGATLRADLEQRTAERDRLRSESEAHARRVQQLEQHAAALEKSALEEANARLFAIEDELHDSCRKTLSDIIKTTKATEATLSFRLGYALINAPKSWRNLVHLPRELLELRREAKRRGSKSSPVSLLGKPSGRDVAAMLEMFETHGVEGALSFIENSNRAPKSQAHLYTGLAKALVEQDALSACRVAQLAYEADPRPFRKKWLAFLLFDCGNIRAAAELVRGLPDEVSLQSSELAKMARINGLDRLMAFRPELPSDQKTAYEPLSNSVLYVAASAQPFHLTGYTNRTQGLLAEIQAAGWHVTCAMRPGYPEDRFDRLKEALSESHRVGDILYLHLPGPHRRKVGLDEFIRAAALSIESTARELQPAIIHAASNFENALPALIAARRLGIPFVYEVRGLWEYTTASKKVGWESSEQFALERDLENLVAKEADSVLTLSEALANELRERGLPGERITLVPNAIDAERFAPHAKDAHLMRRFGLTEAQFTIVYVGSLAHYEGLDHLLRALAILVGKGIDAHLLAAGAGEAQEDLTRLAAELNLGSRLKLVGVIAQEEAPRYWSLADAVALPRKPLKVCELVGPLKPLEAMAMAKPLVLSDLPALREIVTPEKTGLLCRAGDSSSLSEALLRLAKDKALRDRLGAAARESVLAEWTWRAVTRRVLEVYGRWGSSDGKETLSVEREYNLSTSSPKSHRHLIVDGQRIAVRCLQDKSKLMTSAERDFMLANALDMELDDTSLCAVAEVLSSMGVIGPLGAIVAEVERRFSRVGGSASEPIQRMIGYQKLFRQGVSVPRRAPRSITPRSRVALSFLHAVPPYHTSGYAVRSHAIGRAAKLHMQWSLRPHTRIGYPWDVRGTDALPNTSRTFFDGIEYIHEKGSIGFRGDLHEYITRAAIYVERAIFNERPALVHAASNYVNALPALIGARRTGLPFVYEVRGLWELTHAAGYESWLKTDRYSLDKHIETTIAREADGVVAITNGVRQELIARGVAPERIILAPNCIEADEFLEVPRDLALAEALGMDPDLPTIGYIGSFVDYEGLNLLLEVMARMQAEGLRFNALMVGDGRDMPGFRQRVGELGLTDLVKSPGRVPFEDVPRYYSLIDIAPFPRLQHQVCELVSPLKPLEALVLGKLVIGSSVGGVCEIIDHDVNGLVFKAGDTQSLYETLRRAVVDLRSFSSLRAKGRDWVRANRRWATNAMAMDDLFERLAPPSAPVPGRPLVRAGTLVSVTVPEPKPTTLASIKFELADGTCKSVWGSISSVQHNRSSVVNIIAPSRAVALKAVERSDAGPQPVATVCDRPVPLNVESSIAFKRLDRVVMLKHEANLSFSALILAGGHYEIEFVVKKTTKGRNQACLLMLFPQDAKASTEIEDSTHSPEIPIHYYQIESTEGIQKIEFTAPCGAHVVEVIFQVDGKQQRAPEIALWPYVTVHGTYTDGDQQVFDLRDSLIHDVSIPTPIELTSDALNTTVAVQSGSRYLITPQIWVSEAIDKHLPQVAVVTIDFTDNKDGDYCKQSGLSYSKTLDVYFRYVSAAKANRPVRVRIPPQINRMTIGLRRWQSHGHAVFANHMIAIQPEQGFARAIEHNIDTDKVNVLLFADLDLNRIDGSAIWLMSVAEALSIVPQTTVHLLSRNPLQERPFLQRLRQLSNCRVLDPVAQLDLRGPIASEDAAGVITRLDAEVGGFDYIIARGFRVNVDLSLEPRLGGRLCPYLTDIPQQAEEMTAEARHSLEAIFRRAHQVLLQSKWLIEFVASQFPQHANKISMLPPMIPGGTKVTSIIAGGIGATSMEPNNDGVPRIVYTGKMAPEWGILELFAAFDSLRAEMPNLELYVIGSKIHNPTNEPNFAAQVSERLQSGRGLIWRPEMSRDGILHILPKFSAGWAWREPAFEQENRELSTKLLEYGASQLPAVVTRTHRYEQLLGKDYPFFADDATQICDALRRAISDVSAREMAARALASVANAHSLAAIANRQLAPVIRPRQRHKGVVLIAGHDFKFAGDIEAGLVNRGWWVHRDVWRGHDSHDVNESRRLLARADSVFCEWALGNLVWYSNNVSGDQRLVARLHAQELKTHHLNRVQWSTINTLFFVCDTYRREAIDTFGVPSEKTLVIPNLIDCNWFSSASDDAARFNIGIVGIVPQQKRLDRALTVIERLCQEDNRYLLYVKGKMPYEYPWMRNRPDEMRYFDEQLNRIKKSTPLSDHVVFSGFEPNMSSWYQTIGFMLSTSDSESFHMSVAESAAGGTIPVVFPWPAAPSIYPPDWIVADEQAAVDRITAINRLGAGGRADQREQARHYIRHHFDSEDVLNQIEATLL